jgi:NADP-dependent 3-hydroxy-3-methylglutaryl-CoA reductase
VQKPQPKWHVLKSMNIVVTSIFIATVGLICYNFNEMNSGKHTQQQAAVAAVFGSVSLPYTAVLALCLVYFLGFFGISFLDTDEMTNSPQNFGLQNLHANAQREAAKSEAVNQHRPMHDAPICAENGSSSKPSPQSTDTPSAPEVVAPASGIDFTVLNDDEVFAHLVGGTLKDHQLEKELGDMERAVCIRRRLYEHILGKKMDLIPYTNYDYDKVFGANCEIVVGYVPIPVGIVGPLVINGDPVYVPMATTEGCLVASTNRGCKAISASGGCFAAVLKDAITRAPCVRLPNAMRAAAMKKWVEIPENYVLIESAFNSTTNFGRLDSVDATVAGRNVYLRFCCMSGDAMGMNMVSKGCLKAMEVLQTEFPDMVLVAISGNMCTDKKPSAINWILGRGKSVVVEAVIPEKVVKSVLKCSVHDMIETNKQKNHIGSAMAGSIGGFNAHAANIVTALYLATGQDPAQNVESSNCITIMDFADVSSLFNFWNVGRVDPVCMCRMESRCKLVLQCLQLKSARLVAVLTCPLRQGA